MTYMKNKRSKKQESESCSYCIEILDWSFPYYFAINTARHISDKSYLEGNSLELKGKLIYPKKHVDKTIDITIRGSRQLLHAIEHPERYDTEPTAVGDLKIRGKERELYCFVPIDALNTIMLALQAGKIKYLELSGHALRYGSADIRSVHYSKEYTPED